MAGLTRRVQLKDYGGVLSCGGVLSRDVYACTRGQCGLGIPGIEKSVRITFSATSGTHRLEFQFSVYGSRFITADRCSVQTG